MWLEFVLTLIFWHSFCLPKNLKYGLSACPTNIFPCVGMLDSWVGLKIKPSTLRFLLGTKLWVKNDKLVTLEHILVSLVGGWNVSEIFYARNSPFLWSRDDCVLLYSNAWNFYHMLVCTRDITGRNFIVVSDLLPEIWIFIYSWVFAKTSTTEIFKKAHYSKYKR